MHQVVWAARGMSLFRAKTGASGGPVSPRQTWPIILGGSVRVKTNAGHYLGGPAGRNRIAFCKPNTVKLLTRMTRFMIVASFPADMSVLHLAAKQRDVESAIVDNKENY